MFDNITNLEIANLQGGVNEIDSFVDYSEVTLSITQLEQPKPSLSFSKRISKIFAGSWSALTSFLQVIAVVVVAVFPFALVLTPVGVGVFYIRKFYLRKKEEKRKANANKNNLE